MWPTMGKKGSHLGHTLNNVYQPNPMPNPMALNAFAPYQHHGYPQVMPQYDPVYHQMVNLNLDYDLIRPDQNGQMDYSSSNLYHMAHHQVSERKVEFKEDKNFCPKITANS